MAEEWMKHYRNAVEQLTADLRASVRLVDALAFIDELEAEIERLRAVIARIDQLHVCDTEDDMEFCHVCVGAWPCRTHSVLHPKEARRG